MSNTYNIDINNQSKLEKIKMITHDIYNVNEYKKIYKELEEKINEFRTDNVIKTLENIFNYYANINYYDYDGVKQTDINNQNLINPIFNNKGVCEGYSKLIEQICSLLNIECITVSGGNLKEEGGHIWNQIKIDKYWYNVDITVQSYAFHNGKNWNMFLVPDEELAFKCESPFGHKCNKKYKD